MPLIQALNGFFKLCFDFDAENLQSRWAELYFLDPKFPNTLKQVKAISLMDNDLEKLYGVANGPDNHQCDRPERHMDGLARLKAEGA